MDLLQRGSFLNIIYREDPLSYNSVQRIPLLRLAVKRKKNDPLGKRRLAFSHSRVQARYERIFRRCCSRYIRDWILSWDLRTFRFGVRAPLPLERWNLIFDSFATANEDRALLTKSSSTDGAALESTTSATASVCTVPFASDWNWRGSWSASSVSSSSFSSSMFSTSPSSLTVTSAAAHFGLLENRQTYEWLEFSDHFFKTSTSMHFKRVFQTSKEGGMTLTCQDQVPSRWF